MNSPRVKQPAWDLHGEPATLSIGAATFPDDATTLETLMAQSDAAMYSAKARGRNQVVSASGRPAQESGPTGRGKQGWRSSSPAQGQR